MPDPVTMAIATAVVGKVAETLTDQAKQALSQITQRIHAKFRHQPGDLAILNAAQASPSTPGNITQVAALLDQAIRDDPAFGNEIRALWQQAHIEITSTSNTTTNTFHGQADKVVQINDVHGDLTIN